MSGEPKSSLSITASAPAPPDDEPVNILLVDDEPRNLTVLESILDDPGYRLVRAESGDQALLALVASEFAVIVLDIHMPGMSGFELAQLVKRRPKTASIPIIFLTAHYSEDRHVLEGYETGAVDYLHKPVNAVVVRSKVAVFAELYRKTRESYKANRALVAEVTERRRVQEEMRDLNSKLEQHVAERTAELLSANHALQQIQTELLETDRRKDQFLAMLGHELRNPLAPIRNAITILKGNGLDENSVSWCRDVIERQADHLTRIVDDLLDVSRVSRGKIQIEKGFLDLAAVIQQAVEICRPLIDARRHELTLSLPPAPVLVEGDFTRLVQVVANLINNAAKYTDEKGSLWVGVEIEADSPLSEEMESKGMGSEGKASEEMGSDVLEPDARDPAVRDHAVIRVRDNGRGMDAKSLSNLFELFYQADTNLDRSDGGLGVGLALVRSLIEMHGGTVEGASPGLGSGSEFIVRLPHAARAVRLDTTDVSVPVTEKGEPSNLRILVVDDNRDAARSLAMMLQILGHQVSMAHEGRRAVDVALAERPDVILLDIGLPGLNGYEVCRSLRQQGLTSQLIAAITGYGQESDRLLAMEAGFDVHLVKPVSFPTIRQLLARDCGINATGDR